jgi:hypothetical protein
MQERVRLLRDRMSLQKKDDAGDRARAEFLQATNYHIRLSERVSKSRQDALNSPSDGYGDIALLCDVYGSDKGSLTDDERQHPYAPLPAHTYTDIYEIIFRQDDRISKVKNVFECGIGTTNPLLNSNMTSNGRPGASLRVWRDFFKNAFVWGADIDKDVLFEEERIQTGYMDQTKPDEIKNFFARTGIEKFDIMIDDGLHTFEAAKCLFETAVNSVGGGLLSDEGIYCIEDLLYKDIIKLYVYLKDDSSVIAKYYIMETPSNFCNNLVVIRKNTGCK